jgi:hypothetical protein
MKQIAAPRIGTGKGYFIAGWVLFGLTVLVSFAAAGGGEGAREVASLLGAIGAGCFAVGFWVKLFGALERRLIDIQEALGAPGSPAGNMPPAEPSIITGRPAMSEVQY